MADAEAISGKTLMTELKGKLQPWLKAYLDESNPATFMNGAGSARAAGYKCQYENGFAEIGSQNSSKLKDRINWWLDNEGLSERRLKSKMFRLMEAKQAKVIAMKGALQEDALGPGTSVLARSTQTKLGGTAGIPYDEEHTLIAVDQEALETQRRTLDMAFKVKGLYAPTDVNLGGLEGLAERLAKALEKMG